MPIQTNDRPKIELEPTKDGLKISWGPLTGPWGIYSKGGKPENVIIKEWFLHVGTKAHPGKKPEQEEEEGYKWETFDKSVGTDIERIFPWKSLPQEQVSAEVIGFFSSHTVGANEKAIDEGIYSNVESLAITPALLRKWNV